jgi:hypothetical protein
MDMEEAWLSAAQSIASNLEFELKKVPIFTIKTGVLEVHGNKVVIERGKNLGIRKSYEFEIIRAEELSSGYKKEKHAGLVLVKSVYEEISEATVLYGFPREGDQLVEVPRLGMEGLLYVHILSPPPFEYISILPGLKVVWSEGLYLVKPVFGIELPIADMSAEGKSGYFKIFDYGLPLNFYIGCDINLYMGRFQITPTLAGSATLIVPWDTEEDSAGFTHLGFKGYVSINYLFHRDFKVSLDAGYSWWFTLLEDYKSYGGVLGGLAFVWKS